MCDFWSADEKKQCGEIVNINDYLGVRIYHHMQGKYLCVPYHKDMLSCD